MCQKQNLFLAGWCRLFPMGFLFFPESVGITKKSMSKSAIYYRLLFYLLQKLLFWVSFLELKLIFAGKRNKKEEVLKSFRNITCAFSIYILESTNLIFF